MQYYTTVIATNLKQSSRAGGSTNTTNQKEISPRNHTKLQDIYHLRSMELTREMVKRIAVSWSLAVELRWSMCATCHKNIFSNNQVTRTTNKLVPLWRSAVSTSSVGISSRTTLNTLENLSLWRSSLILIESVYTAQQNRNMITML